MDAPLHPNNLPTLPNGISSVHPADENPHSQSSSPAIQCPQSKHGNAQRKNRKKKQALVSDFASSASSNNCSCSTLSSHKGIKLSRTPKRFRVGSMTRTRRSVGLSDVDALGLPLGMSIAAVVAQVLEQKSAAAGKLSVDYLSDICNLAVKESLGNVFGDRFDNFVANFETSFRSTLTTLRLISSSSQIDGEQLQRARSRRCSCSATSNLLSPDPLISSAYLSDATEGESLPHRNISEQQHKVGYWDSSLDPSCHSSHDRTNNLACPSDDTDGPIAFPDCISSDGEHHTHSQMEKNVKMKPLSQQLVLHGTLIEQQLACASPCTSSFYPAIDNSMLSTIEKSLMEQTRSNELKTYEIGLIKKRLQLKERQLELSSSANLLDRWKLSMGYSKASFKAEKFKTQLQDSRQIELLKNCLDFLVAGLIMMLFSLSYGTYIYSHQRIIEATEACSPYEESKSSWWMPKSMSNFNSGFQLLKCQIQVLSRMLFGALLIVAVVFLLVQRSASSHQTMPLTFILLLLALGCGCAGKFCIDTLGGSGNEWLIYWEPLCLLHFLSSTFYSTLYTLLYGPITVTGRVELKPIFPYWVRRMAFYATLLVLPLLCGLIPFASLTEWFNHFSDLLTYVDD